MTTLPSFYLQAKKHSYSTAKDHEKGEESLSDAKSGKGKYSEKDISKVL